MPSQAFPPSKTCAEKPFEKVHSDLKSFPVVSYHKHKYFISFIDDYMLFSWIVLLHNKASAIAALQHFLATVKNQFNAIIKHWMSDAGGEYKSDAFLKMLKDNGINVMQSTPNTPQQNGRAEQFNRTCMDKAEAMHHQACLPQSYWEFAVEHAVHYIIGHLCTAFNGTHPLNSCTTSNQISHICECLGVVHMCTFL